jgi:hypothetical protein
MSQKKLIVVILVCVLFIACTMVISFASVGHSAHAASKVVALTPVPGCPPTIAYGSSGTWVRELQIQLNAQEGAKLTIDGQFGSLTRQAVYKWQRSHNLSVDGIVGRHTWHSLGFC